MNLLSTTCLLSEFIAFSRKHRKHGLFSCNFQASKRHIRPAMCASYSIQYTSVYSPNLKLNLAKHKNPKNLKQQLKSSTLKLRQENKEKESRNLLGWCMVDASKLKMHKESIDAKCSNFWREKMQRRSFQNLANVSVTNVTLT